LDNKDNFFVMPFTDSELFAGISTKNGLPTKVLVALTVLKLARNVNTDGWGNKLVTIFAPHLDNFILTNNFSLICQIRDFGSGQILQPRQFYLSPEYAKIAPW
jgi:hypothetical protein